MRSFGVWVGTDTEDGGTIGVDNPVVTIPVEQMSESKQSET